jgi:hypothetical protein
MKPMALVVVAAAAATTARAQALPFGLAGSGLAYSAQFVVRYQGEIQTQTGLLIGGAGSAQVGPVTLRLAGLVGKLTPEAPTAANPERTVRTTSLAVYGRPAPLIAIGVEAEARRYETTAGVSWVRLVGAAANIAVPLGLPGIMGSADLEFFPLSSVSGSDSPSLAVRGMFGLAYMPPSGPIMLQVAYRLERFDFKASGTMPARLEQMGGIVFGAGLRVRR